MNSNTTSMHNPIKAQYITCYFHKPKAVIPWLFGLVIMSIQSLCLAVGDIPYLKDNYLDLSNGEIMHYYDEGNPKGKPVILVHGYPTSAFLYRDIITELCPNRLGDFRCIAITHIGFGKSSCPDDGSSVSPLYEVTQLEEFIAKMNLNDFAMVVHDWGGPIGTLAGLRNHELMSHLVVLNTVLSFPEQNFIARVMDFFALWLEEERPAIEAVYSNAMARSIQLLTNKHLSQRELARYREPFNDDEGACRTHASANLFAKAHSDEALFEEIAQRAKSDWQENPTVLFWGLDDPLFGNKSQAAIDVHLAIEELFPQAETIEFEANHFMQEDQPESIAAEIRYFIETN